MNLAAEILLGGLVPLSLVGGYRSPTAGEVILRTGLSPDIEALTADQFAAKLASLIPDAEARTAVSVTEAIFDSTTLTPRQVTLLQRAVSLRTGANYLLLPEVQRGTGTNNSLSMEQVASFRDLAQHLERQAEELDFLVRVPQVVPDLSNPRVAANVMAKQLQLAGKGEEAFRY